jgi:hypothetical protein
VEFIHKLFKCEGAKPLAIDSDPVVYDCAFKAAENLGDFLIICDFILCVHKEILNVVLEVLDYDRSDLICKMSRLLRPFRAI